MAEENQGFGFPSRADPYDQYIGQPVVAHLAGGTVYGFYRGKENGVAVFKPSLVGSPDNSLIFLQDKLPTTMGLPIVGMRALSPGMLEKSVGPMQKSTESRQKPETQDKDYAI